MFGSIRSLFGAPNLFVETEIEKNRKKLRSVISAAFEILNLKLFSLRTRLPSGRVRRYVDICRVLLVEIRRFALREQKDDKLNVGLMTLFAIGAVSRLEFLRLHGPALWRNAVPEDPFSFSALDRFSMFFYVFPCGLLERTLLNVRCTFGPNASINSHLFALDRAAFSASKQTLLPALEELFEERHSDAQLRTAEATRLALFRCYTVNRAQRKRKRKREETAQLPRRSESEHDYVVRIDNLFRRVQSEYCSQSTSAISIDLGILQVLYFVLRIAQIRDVPRQQHEIQSNTEFLCEHIGKDLRAVVCGFLFIIGCMRVGASAVPATPAMMLFRR